MSYNSCNKKVLLDSPFTEQNVKRIVLKSYPSLSTALTTSVRTGQYILNQVIRSIKKEIKAICSLTHDSILRDDKEALKYFSWETVWLELLPNVPTLLKILSALVPNPEDDKPLLCLIVSMLLKRWLPKMGLVQRALSLVLYGNGTSKQACDCLHFLVICCYFNRYIIVCSP